MQENFQFDLEPFFDKYGISYGTVGDQHILECPMCQKKKLYVQIKSYLYFCFRCGERGNLIKLIKLIAGTDAPSILNKLFDEVLSGPIRFLNRTKPVEAYDELNEYISEPLEDWTVPIVQSDSFLLHTYIKKRKITNEMIEIFDIRFSKTYERNLINRLIFPFYSLDGNLVGWTARDVTDSQNLRYRNSPGLIKRLVLYGAHIHKDVEEAILVEGPIDAIKAHKFGGMAILGKYLSKSQFSLLLSLPRLKSIYVALDPDAEAESINTAKTLCGLFDIKLVNYPVGFDGDIGDMTEHEIEDLLANSTKYSKSKMIFDLRGVNL